MLREERLDLIKKSLLENKKVLVEDLCKEFDVSDVTIRKDLQLLNKEGFAKRIHGGALLNRSSFSLPTVSLSKNESLNFTNTQDEDIRKREVLAELAVSKINEGDSIFLGSGLTCALLAKKLNRFNDLRVVTNNLSALMTLMNTKCKVYVIGGEVSTVDSKTYFSSIENASQYLQSIFVSKAFTSCSGIDLEVGITVNSMISTHIYKTLSSINRHWYMMVDEDKFDRIGIYNVAKLEEINCVIATNIPNKYTNYFNSKNITYLTQK